MMPLFEVQRGKAAGHGAGATPGVWLNTMGQLVVMDWYQAMILDGRGYQVKAGTISVPLVGDVVITDTAAEFAVNATAGLTVIPTYQSISVNLATGTLHEYATKSVGTASTGTAFVPLLLKTDGAAASSTALVDGTGGTTTAAEVATTTRQHWAYGNAVAVAAGGAQPVISWEPAVTGSPVLVGTSATTQSLYTQIAATGAGPSYFANLDFIEVPTLMVTPS